MIDRAPDNNNAYTDIYTSPLPVRAGVPIAVSFTLYADPGGSGAVVGVGGATVTMASDGSGIGTLQVAGVVQTVTVVSGQSVGVGQTTDLIFSARDSGGALVAVTPGSALWQVVRGTDRLSLTGSTSTALGLLPGTAQVVATVDGIPSSATDVEVTSDARVTITPDGASVMYGHTLLLTAQVANAPDSTVTWSVEDGAGDGASITQGGQYTAPATPGTYHVTARSVYDPLKSATVSARVFAIGVSISPDPVTTTLQRQTTFTASLTDATNPSVTWRVEEGDAGGTITPAGVYTAPRIPGTYHVIATSVEDPTRFHRATVTVSAGSGGVIIQ